MWHEGMKTKKRTPVAKQPLYKELFDNIEESNYGTYIDKDTPEQQLLSSGVRLDDLNINQVRRLSGPFREKR